MKSRTAMVFGLGLAAGIGIGVVQGRHQAHSDEVTVTASDRAKAYGDSESKSAMEVAGDTTATRQELAGIMADWHLAEDKAKTAPQAAQVSSEAALHTQWLLVAQNDKIIDILEHIRDK